jgi:subtilisin family serine protease
VVTSFFYFSGLPEFYDDKLLVRVARERPMAVASSTMASSGSALTELQKEGLILSVTPISAQVQQAQVASMAVSGGIYPPAEAPEDQGSSVVEVRSGEITRVLRRLESKAGVEAERLPARYLCATPAAMPPRERPLWNLKRIRWEESRALKNVKQATDITVAVLDTGVQLDHPGLNGRIDSYDHSHVMQETMSDKDLHGHGTHVAGIVGGVTNNGFGIRGVCECRLKVWKIFRDDPQFMPAQNMFCYVVDPVAYLEALVDCFDQSVNVVNLSIAGPGKPSPEEETAIKRLIEKGTTVVAAMGNERMFGSPTSYPAAIPGVVAVGATNLNDEVTRFSSRGEHISLCAPGQAIWSTLPSYPGQIGFLPKRTTQKKRERSILEPDLARPITREKNYDAWDGTSMAAPHVTGAVALLLANQGKDSPKRVREALEKTADAPQGNDASVRGEKTDAEKDPDYGAGRLNLLKLLQ